MADDILLTRKQLEDLTGVERPSAMVNWLQARGWIFEPPARSADYPKVARAYFDHRMLGTPLPGPRRVGPRLDFMKAATA